MALPLAWASPHPQTTIPNFFHFYVPHGLNFLGPEDIIAQKLGGYHQLIHKNPSTPNDSTRVQLEMNTQASWSTTFFVKVGTKRVPAEMQDLGIAMTANTTAEKKYLTQKELAKHWCLSQSCVKNYRDAGVLPYFRLPQSSRVLYPLAEIEQLEAAHTYPKGKEVPQQAEIKKEKPGISSARKKWRI